jgi:group I intron endonuclease
MYAVYIITNTVNAKQYVGISVDLERRWKQHCSANGSSPYLHKAIKKYGIEAFVFTHFADAFDEEAAKAIEQILINEKGTKAPKGYNLTDGGDGIKNPSQSVRDKIGYANKNRSKKSRESVSRKLTGRKASEETKRKQFLAKIGSKRTNETKAKMSNSLKGNKRMLGKKHSSETIAKMKLAWAARKLKSSSKKELK